MNGQAEIFEAQPWAEEGLECPDLETLMDWESDGGCKAACPDGCWVEFDGWCAHGRPSWALILGLV